MIVVFSVRLLSLSAFTALPRRFVGGRVLRTLREEIMNGKSLGWVVAAVAVMALGTVLVFRTATAQPAAPAAPAAGPKYTVVDTEATNLLVVDNSTNVVYFYTVDEGKEPGSDMHLRGSLDLNDVGKPTLKPKKTEKK